MSLRRPWLTGFCSVKSDTLHLSTDCGKLLIRNTHRAHIVERITVHSIEDKGHYARGRRIGYPKTYPGYGEGRVWLCKTCTLDVWRMLPAEDLPELGAMRILASLPVEQRHVLMQYMRFETDQGEDSDYVAAIESLVERSA